MSNSTHSEAVGNFDKYFLAELETHLTVADGDTAEKISHRAMRLPKGIQGGISILYWDTPTVAVQITANDSRDTCDVLVMTADITDPNDLTPGFAMFPVSNEILANEIWNEFGLPELDFPIQLQPR